MPPSLMFLFYPDERCKSRKPVSESGINEELCLAMLLLRQIIINRGQADVP